MNYHKYFINSNQNASYQEIERINFFMNQLDIQDLCPFAAHSIFPYIFAFKKGSWFRWEKSKNSVVAQCPNPDTCLTFKITRESSGFISVKVINQKKECYAGHKTGDMFKLSKVTFESLKFNSCDLNNIKSLSVSVVSHSKLCRYYQEPGQIVEFMNLAPSGFCLPAYYSAYTYSLSLLYDGADFEKAGREKTAELFCCLKGNDYIKMLVSTKRNIFTYILNFIEKTLRFIGYPKDVLDKAVKIEVSEVKGHCPKGLVAGHKVNFNLYNKQELCPAVFYNLFPYLCMLNRKIFPYWVKDESRIDIHCPDACADITYRINIAEYKD